MLINEHFYLALTEKKRMLFSSNALQNDLHLNYHMRQLLLFCLLSLCSSAIFSQHLESEISTPRKLTEPTATLAFIPYPIDLPGSNFGDIGVPYLDPYPVPSPWPYVLPELFYYVPTPCGEKHYENGNLESRCECDDQKRKHGKLVQWSPQGRISKIEHYSHDRRTYSKAISPDGSYDINRYYYRNGAEELHGVQEIFDGVMLTKTPYRYGKKHGNEVKSIKGKKYEESLYEDDMIRKTEAWDSEGKRTRLRLYDDNGFKTGNWYSFESADSSETLEEYTANLHTKKEVFQNGKLTHKFLYENGNLVSEETYFDNEKMATLHIITLGISHYQAWSETGEIIKDYSRSGEGITGKGFVKTENVTYCFEEVRNGFDFHYLVTYKVVDDDTITQTYNHPHELPPEGEIHLNNFIEKDGQMVRHGDWRIYSHNKILYEANYSYGIFNGDFVLYDTSGWESRPYLKGSYRNGLAYGEWEYWDRESRIRAYFQEGKVNGNCSVYHRTADTVLTNPMPINILPQEGREIYETLTPVVEMELDGNKTIGHSKTYHSNGNIHWDMQIDKTGKTGTWTEHNSNGERIRYGIFTENELQKSWMKRTYTKRGKIKWKRDKEVVITPMLNVADYLAFFNVTEALELSQFTDK